MATINKLKNKARNTSSVPAGNLEEIPTLSSISSPLKPQNSHNPQQSRSRPSASSSHTPQKEQEYESYYELAQSNPNGFTASSTLFPNNNDLQVQFNVPLSLVISPISALENQVEVMEKTADKIPKCIHCRAYMNCYNRIEKNGYICFLCNNRNNFDKEEYQNNENNLEMNSSVYQSLGPTNYYLSEPKEDTYVFLIDISSDAYHSKMLFYTITVLKEILAREELDEVCIHFFTYDELIHQYDFTGEEIKCTVVDQTIQAQQSPNFDSCELRNIREKIMSTLDALEEISQNNHRLGSNFAKTFDYVFHELKHTSAKFFVFQSNEAINGENLFWEEPVKPKQSTAATEAQSTAKSLFETKNKNFFNSYTEHMLKNECSFSFFFFAKNFKNLRVIHDSLKLTNSEMKVYSKDSLADLNKFYYDLNYLLGATYFKNLRVEFIIGNGWYFSAIYGNFYRLKEFITFQINWFEQSRKLVALVTSSKNSLEGNPYFSMQVITNYRYKRQSFMNVATIVQPLTGHIERLYASINDPTIPIISLAKGFLSSMRMEPINVARKKLTETASTIYQSALATFKKQENIPDSIMSILMGVLALLKSIHSQPELINNTPIFDKILSERNLLQFSGPSELGNIFNPYLFDLTNMDESMCSDISSEFVYPPTVETSFSSIRNGLFLMDAGLSLYLFVAKQCDPSLLYDVFGTEKLTKNYNLSEELLNEQTSFRACQVQNLVRFIREQKAYGWVPLHIVRCMEKSLNERNFYLNFYPEKYEEFKNYNLNLQEFLTILSKPHSF